MTRLFVPSALLLCSGLVACNDDLTTDDVGPTDEVAGRQGLTWHDDIAPFLADNCAGCHQPGGIAPFALTSYEQVKSLAPVIEQSLVAGSMPPFDAQTTEECTPVADYLHDARLSATQIADFRQWVEEGMVEGEPKAAPELPAPDHIEDPDAVLALPAPFEVTGTRDIYQCFRIPLETDVDVFLQALEVLPDNDQVVHHVLVWADPDDASADLVNEDGNYPCGGTPEFGNTNLLGIWTPGAGVSRLPEGTGATLKAGSSVVVNMHYHPTSGTTGIDQTQVALEWSTTPPDDYISWFLIDLPFGATVQDAGSGETDFVIPPGAEAHQEHLTFGPFDIDFLPDFRIYAITPHMHYLGTEMLVTVTDGSSGDETCLVHSPTYRFEWQTQYTFDLPLDELPTFGKGDHIDVRCTYNNSWSNVYMSDHLEGEDGAEPGFVTWGDETTDEMCTAMIGLVLPFDPSILVDQMF